MSNRYDNEPMLDIYIFESTNILDQLEQIIISSEKDNSFDDHAINEIFRFMHTIKGSSAMMLFNEIAETAHVLEDLFYFIREKKPSVIDYSSLSDLVLEGLDFIKIETNKIKNGDEADGNPAKLIEEVQAYLATLRGQYSDGNEIKKPVSQKPIQYYIPQDKRSKAQAATYLYAKVFFKNGCEMENIRAYTLVFGLTEYAEDTLFFPKGIAEDDKTALQIRENGFELYIKAKTTLDEVNAFIDKTVYLDRFELVEIDESAFLEVRQASTEDMVRENEVIMPHEETKEAATTLSDITAQKEQGAVAQALISVNVEKLDRLMNLVGELVIAEAMVTQNPDVAILESESFLKSSRLLHKITGELQDMVMAIRMVPLSTTFMKMHRIVRDMSKKLNKDIDLQMLGEETEVDKNIIEHISDPLMHLIRNSIDHGIESEKDRLESGKDKKGHVLLEARNIGSEVVITLKDDGRGLNREKILQKARENGLLTKPEHEMSTKEIYNLIMLPGFSTKEQITEFSGRGVGMDVVANNLEAVGGVIGVDSEPGQGTTITLRIPLTLAIVEGMNVRVGQSRYTIPITAIKESFKPERKDCIQDPDGNESVMVRGLSFPILRLHEQYQVKEAIQDLTEGILIMVEQDDKQVCLFADELLGQNQVVVKSLPNYIKTYKKILGIAGCTLLGDGSISLILDISGLAGLRIR